MRNARPRTRCVTRNIRHQYKECKAQNTMRYVDIAHRLGRAKKGRAPWIAEAARVLGI